MNAKQRRALSRSNPRPGTPVRIKVPHWSGYQITQGIIHPTRKPWGSNVLCVQVENGWHMVPHRLVEVIA